MAILLKVKWVDQTVHAELHERVRHIGGDSGQLRWKHTREQAVQSIEDGQFAYYVEKDARALLLEVGVAPGGVKYLRTPDDNGQHQFLLGLPECPNPV